MTRVIGSIREYFLLDQARATAKIVPEDMRVALSRQLALGRQRAEAADALWSNGHVSEGLRLAVDAFEATLLALDPLAQAIAGPTIAGPATAAPATAEPATERTEPTEAALAEPSLSGSEPSEEPAVSEQQSEELDPIEETAVSDESEAQAEPLEPEPKASAAEVFEPEAEAEARPVVEETRPAVEEMPAISAVSDPTWAAVLRRRGLSESKTREVVETRRQLAAKPLPSLDEEVSAAEGELFQQLASARRHVDRVIAPASMTSGQLSWTRVSRLGFAAFIGLATLAGLYLVLRPATGVTATASGQWSAEFSGERAVDGDPATEWLLPDRQAGWLDLRIAPATRMERLRLKNSHNRHYNDRGTEAYTIEVYSNDQLVRTVEGEWSEISPRPDWTEHALGVDDVNRIRIQVRSWHRVGGGLAEVDWD